MISKKHDLPQSLALMLLAAGRARRFGRDKLAESVAGRPLCQHAALAFADLPFARRIAVVSASDHGLPGLGFKCLRVEAREAALSVSIATGMRAIVADPAIDGVMIALGDMPLVSPGHIAGLLAAFDGVSVASAIQGRPQPPALFGRSHFPALLSLQGDMGARELLANAARVEADPAILADIDTAADLERVHEQIGIVG